MPTNQRLDDWFKERKNRLSERNATALFERICQQDHTALSAAITLIESHRPEDRVEANKLLQLCLSLNKRSWRIGITGVPGVGKSTFIESFGNFVLQHQSKLAVLAIDPSSNVSGGSILGDKTRMETLSKNDRVFIRPTAAGSTLGGVARHTREAIILCEAAGFEVIFIETVGVGQSETIVHSMVDYFLLLMLAGAGDELQGMKRGIMEMADGMIITKADGENVQKAQWARREYANALHLFPPKENEWIPKVHTASSLNKEGFEEIWTNVSSFFHQMNHSGWLEENRKRQEVSVLEEMLRSLLQADFFANNHWMELYHQKEAQVKSGSILAYQAAEELFREFRAVGL
ncbi:MAG: methylmalonyl Co-A mutase-associated GTPase MeaB [Flavobacteriales bacterium]